jgi:hypothetical protein
MAFIGSREGQVLLAQLLARAESQRDDVVNFSQPCHRRSDGTVVSVEELRELGIYNRGALDNTKTIINLFFVPPPAPAAEVELDPSGECDF